MTRSRGDLAVAVLLAALVALVYGRTAGFPFVLYDDDAFLLDNPAVRGGLSPAGLRWALSSGMDAGWIPVTWLSRMLDASLFGTGAGGPHLVNALLHAANALLLFRFLRGATGRFAAPAFAAALFAVHPLHVESVAWVSERKDVLCGFFWLLSLLAWRRHAEAPGARRLAAVVLLAFLAMASKPVAVTLPFTLLLVDGWPLGRFRLPGAAEVTGPAAAAPPGRLLLEKAPLFALSALFSGLTLLLQSRIGAIDAESFPFPVRAANALVSCAAYLGKAAWPDALAVYYPHPGAAIPAWQVGGAALLLCGATALALRAAPARPWLPWGWFWFLGTLVPVLGLVQAGGKGMADRCAYIPMIGLDVAVAFAAAEAARRARIPVRAAAAAAAAVVLALAGAAFVQVGTWRDTGTLFRHALAVAGDNWVARFKLGRALAAEGRDAEAEREYRAAARLAPGRPEPRFALHETLTRLGRDAEAAAELGETLRAMGGGASAAEVGRRLAAAGQVAEAARFFEEAVRANPGDAQARYDLGVALVRLGRKAEARPHFEAALSIPPSDADGFNRAGVALLGLGRPAEARARFREALRLAPGHAEAAFNLAVALERAGDPEAAARQYRAVLARFPNDADARAALARLGARD